MRIASYAASCGADKASERRRGIIVVFVAASLCVEPSSRTHANSLGAWDVTVVHGAPIAGHERLHVTTGAPSAPPHDMTTASKSAPPSDDVQKPFARTTPSAANEATLAEKYCASIADAAKAAWLQAQMRKLAEAEKQIEDRLKALEAKTEQHKLWLGKREEFERRSNDSLLKIYGRMKPDAAAAQLQGLDDLTAAAILSRLDPKIASQLMAEMEAGRAARLSATMASVAGLTATPRVEKKGETVR